MRSKTAGLGLALLATSALTVATLDVAAQRGAEAELARLLAAHPGVAVARIEASPLLGHVILFGVTATSGATNVAIGRLRLPLGRPRIQLIDSAAASPFDDESAKPAPAPAPPAAATAANGGSASAENVVITNGSTTYHIKRIDLAGTSLSNAGLAAILDPNSPTNLADRLKTLTAAAIVVPEIIGDDVKPGNEQHWTERQILLANVVAGKVAAGSAAGVSLATKSQDDVVNGTLGAIEVSGLDLTQIVRVFGTRRTDDGEPLVPLADSFSINGVQFNNLSKNATISIGPIKETGFRGRALKIDPAEANGADKEKSKQVMDDVIRSFAVGSFQATNFAYSDDKTKDKFALASMAMHDVGEAKVGGLNAAGFVFASDNVKIAIGAMEVGAFSIPTRAGAAPGGEPKSTPLPLTGKSDIKDIDVDVTTKPTDPSAQPSQIKFDLKHIGFIGDADATGAPRQGAMSFENLTFDIPQGSGAQTLRDMGYAHLDVSGGSRTSYDAAAQTLAITDFTLSGVDMGSLTLGIDLANVNPALFATNSAAAKVAALAVLLKGFDLRVQNAGFVDRATAWQAKADGVTAAQERDKLVAMATTQIPAIVGNGANAKAITGAVTAFLAAPKTLHLSARSKSGLGMADAALVGTPDVLLDSLDVKASAND